MLGEKCEACARVSAHQNPGTGSLRKRTEDQLQHTAHSSHHVINVKALITGRPPRNESSSIGYGVSKGKCEVFEMCLVFL